METDADTEGLGSYTLQLPAKLKRQLEERAKAEDRTMASLVRRILTKEMEVKK